MEKLNSLVDKRGSTAYLYTTQGGAHATRMLDRSWDSRTMLAGRDALQTLRRLK